MKIERRLLFAAFGAILVAIAPWLYTFAAAPVSGKPDDWSYFGGYVGGVLSPVLAFASFVGLLMTLTQQRLAVAAQRVADDDKNYFNHATSSLQRAYGVISAGEDSGPVRARLAWLTCARLLLSAKEVSALISDESKGLKELFAGEEEHWKYRFYELFQAVNPAVGRDPAFFLSPTDPQREEIDERSIRVVFDFVNWPEGKEDPISRVPRYTREELDSMGLLMSGVREYLLPIVDRRTRRADA